MDAIDQRLLFLFQRLGGGDVRLDHHFFDQLMRIEAFGNDDLVHRTIRPKQDLALRHVEFQRLAAVTAALHHLIGMPQRLQDRFQQRTGLVVRPAVNGCLCLLVGKLRRALHHDAVEGVARLAAFLRKGHPHRKGRAVDAFLQRAEIVGDALRQHRHDAVGEIDGIATLQRLAVQRRTGPHIPGDIGNGDGDDDAVRIVGRRVGLGIDRIVMVLGVGRIDGYERQVAPVLAVRHAGRLGCIRLGKNVRGEDMRNAVGMDRDHRDRLF
ncbi:hypothetical protein D3C86_1280400 [compost metagenome]